MQVCKISKNKKNLLVFSVFFAASILFAQSIEMPQMPQMPEMPSVSLDGTFYKPSVPEKFQNKKKEEKQNAEIKNANENVLSTPNNTDDVLGKLLTNNSLLTASDISSLYDYGLFTDVSSLNTTNSASDYATTSVTNVLLQQVLNSLNELKQEQKNASPKDKNELQDVQSDSNTFKKRQPEILRFKINGYNIADSLKTVFFSDTEPDGTFLLTGDRKYYAGQRQMSETFYILFKTISSNGSSITYRVLPSIVQDVKNENSYVYKLAETKNLTAEKTGNLVVMHFNDNNLNVDLLLDIDRK